MVSFCLTVKVNCRSSGATRNLGLAHGIKREKMLRKTQLIARLEQAMVKVETYPQVLSTFQKIQVFYFGRLIFGNFFHLGKIFWTLN